MMLNSGRRTMKFPIPRLPTFNIWNGIDREDTESPNFDFATPSDDRIDIIEVAVAGLELVVSMAGELGFNDKAIASMQADIDWAKQRGEDYITFVYY